MLIVLQTIIAKHMTINLWQSGFVYQYLHPILNIIFYTPALGIKVISVVIISYIKNKIHPNNNVISKTIFYLILFTTVFTTLIIDPGFFASRRIVEAVCFFLIIHAFYRSKFRYKMHVLSFFTVVFLILTSSIPSIFILWFVDFSDTDTSSTSLGDSVVSSKNSVIISESECRSLKVRQVPAGNIQTKLPIFRLDAFIPVHFSELYKIGHDFFGDNYSSVFDYVRVF